MRPTILKLAAFTLVCLGFTAYLAFTIGNIRPGNVIPFRHMTYDLTATFDDVTGLLPDDNVKVAGVVVGKVRSIGVDDGRARVTFQVRKSLKLPTDTSAAVRWRNLLGQRYVYLYPGAAATVLRGGGHIVRTRSVVDLGELFNRLGPIVSAIDPGQVNAFLDAVVGALDGNEQKLRQAIDDLSVVAKSLGARDEAIGRLVTNLSTVSGAIANRDEQIRTVLDNLLSITTAFSEHTDVLDRAATDLSDVSDHVATLLGGNRAHVDGILSNLATLLGVVQSKIPVLDPTVAGLDEAAAALIRASRYGEMLNQTIPCGRIGMPVAVSVQCNPATQGRQTAPTSGVRAIESLLAPR